MDHVSVATRSRIMSRIPGKDTQPELLVRRYLHWCGLRYRLHVPTLPGKPDIVFSSRRLCVFIHGCFWHGCEKCADGQRRPLSNRGYWVPKIRSTKIRDRQHVARLRASGWKTIAIWECEVSDKRMLGRLLNAILKTPIVARRSEPVSIEALADQISKKSW